MSQSPLAPPPQTGQPIDGWLYLLWRRLTATGQMLWSSIVPGTSADVAAVVTDETGSPGSLVFSGNPTLAGITNSGNLVFTGTANRITGDFSNSTSANRVLFQTTTTNTQTAIGVIPNGSATQGTLIAYNNADPDNAAYVVFLCNATESSFRTSYAGTAGFLPMTFHIGGAEKSRIATSGAFTCGGTSTAPALKVTPVASQARWIEVTGATSSGNPTLGVSGGILAISASVAITGVVSTSGYTVATLPAGTVGDRAYVTDALAPAYGVAVAGGGAVTVPVFYNGAAWICA